MSESASPTTESIQPDAERPTEDVFPRPFGKYTLLQRLAVGGMAELFLALQHSMAGFEKLVVVKRVLPKLASDAKFVEMLKSEARIAASLNHPNVAHIYDVGVVEGEPYIAMEYVHGQDLRSIVRQMKAKGVTYFPLEHALHIVLGCAKGLSYAHETRDLDGIEMGIIHRDVTPQNILVTFNGGIKLVDFGIARARHSGPIETGVHARKGKIPYMSPEQARGETIDQRTDIFSLGVILFELCTGKRLFRAPNAKETLQRITESTYPAASSLNPSISPKLDGIIARCLAKDRDVRYLRASDLQEDLEHCIREERHIVSPMPLSQWMRDLFAEQLEEHSEALRHDRRLAGTLIERRVDKGRSWTSTGQDPQEKPKGFSPRLGLVALMGMLLVAAFTLYSVQHFRDAQQGTIALRSEPSGATVWIDGTLTPHRTPVSLGSLPFGTYAIGVTREGYRPARKEVTVDRSHLPVRMTLQAMEIEAMAVLRIQTSPEGAEVMLDGHRTGERTPTTISELTPGVGHKIVLVRDDFEPATFVVNLESGAFESKHIELEPILLGPTAGGEDEARLLLVVHPPDAQLTIDERAYPGESPWDLRLIPGRRRVRISRGGYLTQTSGLRLQKGETRAAEIRLTRDQSADRDAPRKHQASKAASDGATGTLSVDATPQCRATVNGRQVGSTPIRNLQVQAGAVTIRCQDRSQNRTARRVIHVPANESVHHSIEFR
ncbi:MAG: serine/threonine-protein kinase [Myxococcota bacterium]